MVVLRQVYANIFRMLVQHRLQRSRGTSLQRRYLWAIEQELLSYRRVDGKLQAAEGLHDDCVMALAFALKALRYGENRD